MTSVGMDKKVTQIIKQAKGTQNTSKESLHGTLRKIAVFTRSQISNIHCVKNDNSMYSLRGIPTSETWNIDNLFSNLFVENNIDSWKIWILLHVWENNKHGFPMI